MTVTNSSQPDGTRVSTPAGLASRLLAEGYGPGAWHGPDLRAALDEVTGDVAFGRPAPGRHSIAEIAVHHAYYVRAVRAQLTGLEPEPFVLEGDDWFSLESTGPLSWAQVRRTVDDEQQALAAAVTSIDEGQVASPLGDPERLNLVLGITCHAVYHAGQVQLIKRLL